MSAASPGGSRLCWAGLCWLPMASPCWGVPYVGRAVALRFLALVPMVGSEGRLHPEDTESISGPDSRPEAGLGRVQINFPIALRFGVWESWGGTVKAQV